MEIGINNKVCQKGDGKAIIRLFEKAYSIEKRVDGILHRRRK